MADAILAQDWTTIQGASGVLVTQPERDYVDLGPYQDAVAYLEVSSFSGSFTFELQTSPTRDDNLFKQIDPTVSFTPGTGVTTKVMRYASVAVPLAKLFRWKVTASTTAWSLTFRMWLSPCLA